MNDVVRATSSGITFRRPRRLEASFAGAVSGGRKAAGSKEDTMKKLGIEHVDISETLAVLRGTKSPPPQSEPVRATAASGVGETAALADQVAPAARQAFLDAKNDREALKILERFPNDRDGNSLAAMEYPGEAHRIRTEPMADYLRDMAVNASQMSDAEADALYEKRFPDPPQNKPFKDPRYGTATGFYAPRPKKASQ